MAEQLQLFDEKTKFVRDRRPVLTAKVGTNADLFPDILRIYAKPGDRIADVTYGRGVFWRKVDTSQYECFFTDLAEDTEPPAIGGVGMRDLPYEDESMDIVVIDPPYAAHEGGPAAIEDLAATTHYRVLEMKHRTPTDVLALYQAGMAEAGRVTKPKGLVVVKCQDSRKSKAHWFHIDICLFATKDLGLIAEDLFVLVRGGVPMMRWPHQLHARKNHSYFWVFRKR